jgi:glutamyl-tRNA reductase
MALLACGISHQTAPLALREKLIFTKEVMAEPLLSLVEQTQVSEAAILSTCNRTELYCTSNEPKVIIDWLYQRQQLPRAELEPCLYVHQNTAAVRHILRVASGLDSMVLGEPQILGQLKTAFSLAETAGTLGKQLRRLSHYVFSVSKQVRTTTAVGAHPVSVASAAVNLAKHIFADMAQICVLLIGAGEIIELAARHLRAAGVTKFLIANRTLTRAEKLAYRLQGESLDLAAIPTHLPQADMVVAATASSLPVLGKGAVERALKIRKRRPMFMVDLAVPRNMETEIGDLSDVYLYTLDDLQTLIQQNLQNRQESAQQAEEIIATQANHYMRSLRVLDAVPIVCAYRDKAEKLRDVELAKALQLLKSGMMAEEVLARLARGLTNKLLHAPSVQLKQAAYKEQEEILQLARWLFALEGEK